VYQRILLAASRVTMMMNRQNQATVYTRVECDLCDDAIALLRRKGFVVTTRDIDQDDELRAQFDQCVPVVEINGKVRFRGRINELLLDRLMASG
jgi:glutaredoxin